MKGKTVNDLVNDAKKKGRNTTSTTERGQAFAMKEKANELHRSKKFEEAAELYTKALIMAYQESAERK